MNCFSGCCWTLSNCCTCCVLSACCCGPCDDLKGCGNVSAVVSSSPCPTRFSSLLLLLLLSLSLLLSAVCPGWNGGSCVTAGIDFGSWPSCKLNPRPLYSGSDTRRNGCGTDCSGSSSSRAAVPRPAPDLANAGGMGRWANAIATISDEASTTWNSARNDGVYRESVMSRRVNIMYPFSRFG